jgi:hypothetical protein
MTISIARWWSERKWGSVSIGVCLAEILIVVGAGVLIHTPGRHNEHIISQVTDWAVLLGTPGSFGCAITGLMRDVRRLTAFAAILLSVLTFFISGLLLMR